MTRAELLARYERAVYHYHVDPSSRARARQRAEEYLARGEARRVWRLIAWTEPHVRPHVDRLRRRFLGVLVARMGPVAS